MIEEFDGLRYYVWVVSALTAQHRIEYDISREARVN